MKKIFIYFLLACYLSLFHCGGIDEGVEQFSREEDNSSLDNESGEPRNRRTAEETAPSDTALTESTSPLDGPRERRSPDPNGEEEPAVITSDGTVDGENHEADMSGERPTVTLIETDETDGKEYLINLPTTYICIKDQKVAAYYLYIPGLVGKLCDLHFSGTDEFWYVNFEHGFCEKKLLEKLNEKIREGYTCYCGRPGGPEGAVNITEGGLQCEN